MTERGKFFAIEGGDGSGKATQTKLLTEALLKEGKDVYPLTFPRYGNASAKTVERYLNGEFGEANDVAPELASALYAIDRAAAAPELRDWLKSHPNGVAIADRYVLSNLAHQGAKVADVDARLQFYRDSLNLEFNELMIPQPDKNVILLVPTDAAQLNVDKKTARSYTTLGRDIHEKDANHLTLAKRNYEELAKIFPEFATAIEAYDTQLEQMRSTDEIQAEIRDIFGI